MSVRKLIACGLLAVALGVAAGGVVDAAPPAPSAASPALAAQPASKIVATVNGEAIYEADLLAGLPDDAFAATLEDLKESKLRRLVQETVQLQFLAAHQVTVSEEEMAQGIEAFKAMVKTPGCPCCGGGYKDLDEFMKINAFPMPEVLRRVRGDLGLKLYTERLVKERTAPQALAEALPKQRAGIEADYVRGFAISFNYLAEPGYFGYDAATAAAKEKLAHEARQRLQKGESFTQVAQDMSEDKVWAAQGGALGCIRTDFLGRQVEPVFRKLEPGQYSDVVKTTWGCCIVMRQKLTEDDIRAVLQKQVKSGTEDEVFQEFLIAQQKAKIEYASPPGKLQ